MFLNAVRGLFLMILLGTALTYVTRSKGGDTITETEETGFFASHAPMAVLGAIGIGVIVIGLDILISRKSLSAISGLFVGLLAGLLIAYIFSLVIDLAVGAFAPELREPIYGNVITYGKERAQLQQKLVGYRDMPIVSTIKLLVGAICCYLPVSFILQTKDDIRFVIPYVEFNKQTKGGRPLILDTSAIIDGRIADIASTLVLDRPLLVPRFVLHELQQIADSSDRLKRNRGRRGLDIVNHLQGQEHLDVTIYDSRGERGPVDQRLVALAKELDGKIVTTDYNLNKVAKIRGVEVVNVNDLANALKAVVLPGERLSVKILKPGEEMSQGVGYLEDGTMVVVEGAREKLGKTVNLIVTSALQTSAGRMIFGKCEETNGTNEGRS